MSGTLPLGLAMVSTQTPTVSFRTASRTASGLGATVVTAHPHGSRIFLSTEKVPPKHSLETIRCPPGRASARSVAVVAACPDDKAKPVTPASSATSRFTNTSTVGLCIRPYWLPETSPAKRLAACSALSNVYEAVA